MSTCFNSCTIYGDEKEIALFQKAFKKQYSLSDVIEIEGSNTISEITQRIEKWGTFEEKLHVIGYVSSKAVENSQIICAYDTSIPISAFWKNVSEQYALTVEYEYISSEYAGREHYTYGDLTQDDYTEDIKDDLFLELKEKYSVYIKSEQIIIPMSEILKRKGRNNE